MPLETEKKTDAFLLFLVLTTMREVSGRKTDEKEQQRMKARKKTHPHILTHLARLYTHTHIMVNVRPL